MKLDIICRMAGFAIMLHAETILKSSPEGEGFSPIPQRGQQLAHEYRDRHCIVVLDNAGYHTACVVQKFLDELSCRFQVIWLPPYSPELNDIEHIWKYVKGASLANFDFGDSSSLRQAIAEVFDELNSNPQSDLTLRFRDPLSKNLLKVA